MPNCNELTIKNSDLSEASKLIAPLSPKDRAAAEAACKRLNAYHEERGRTIHARVNANGVIVSDISQKDAGTVDLRRRRGGIVSRPRGETRQKLRVWFIANPQTWLCVSDLAVRTAVPASAVRDHVRKLLKDGLLQTRRSADSSRNGANPAEYCANAALLNDERN